VVFFRRVNSIVMRLTLIKIVRPIFLLVSIVAFASPLMAQRHIEFDGLNAPRLVPIPKPILGLLHEELERDTHLPRMCSVDKSTDVSSWFSASRIDLGQRPRAYLVTPTKPCLTPVDYTRFWIALKTRNGYALVLQAGAIVLDALKTRMHGLRDLETNGATAATNYTAIYKFDGRAYKYYRCFQASPPDAKRQRVPCERN
jgi:hypothetical protein